MPLPRQLLIALAVSAALAFTACGGSEGNERRLIAETRADAMLRGLDRIDADLADGDCPGAVTRINALRGQVERLPEATDGKLVNNLNEWVDHLEGRVDDDCQAAEEEPTASPSPTVTPEETPSPTPTATPDETPSPTATPDDTPEPEPEPEPEPGDSQGPDNGGSAPEDEG